MSVDVILGLMALATGAGAAWFAQPRPPALEGERWFKQRLAAALAARGIDDVDGLVPWHPLGRFVERKLARPGVEVVPAAWLPGEEALVAELAALPDAEARLAHLAGGSTARLRAPDPPLSPAHDARRWLGPRADDLAPAALAAGAARRLGARWVLVAGAPVPGVPDVRSAFEDVVGPVPVPAEVREALAGLLAAVGTPLSGPVLPALELAVMVWERLLLRGVVDAVADALAARIPEDVADARLLVAASGDGAPLVLRALHGHMAVRDRVVAVLSLGGAIGGWPDRRGPLGARDAEDWLAAHFRHVQLDLELVRLVPYASVQWLAVGDDPPGAGGLPVAAQRFPEPGFGDGEALRGCRQVLLTSHEPPAIEPFDLGVLVVDDALPVQDVVDTACAVVGMAALSRR